MAVTVEEIKQFIETIAPIIQRYAKQLGYKNCSAIIAQACNESRYGKSGLSAKYHNYFGLKCGKYWTGASVNMATQEEYTRGVKTDITANFRVYANIEQGVKGYFVFTSTQRYSKLKTATTPQQYLQFIIDADYATSTTYIKDNMWIVGKYNLTKYDAALLDNKTIPPTAPIKPKKDITTVAKEVIAGKWGNGAARQQALEKAGYNYHDVQAAVNRIL